ncbi:LysR family transcriptional regulator [Ferrovibrio sp.]|uniref:LysR family transcriptional regulator n=1 Tax=Ferrovibrio sp. TaxID=1917215 RepID=UPI0025BEBFBC|nr:LysR family transcriptional regulator [Ferrovibrio sp.]MBX3456274.1 LysR family transcriptional regulator [Ferrovibrio sp.]
MADLRNLETFVWVAHLGGFRAAAEKLHATQPAISQRIALLEDELGVKLFDREPRGVVLTPKGTELMPYAERMLQLHADLLQAAREKKAMRGVVRLGVAETIVHTWLAKLIERMHMVYPGITLEIEVDVSPALRERLVSHQLDIAFLLGPVSEPRMRNQALSSYPMAWVSSPNIDLGPEPVALSRLAQWPIITYPRNTRPYIVVREMMTRSDFPGLRMYGNASLSTIVRMTLDGIGISAIPPVVIRRELSEKRLRLIRAEQNLPDLNFTATYPAKPDSYMAEAVLEIAREIADTEARRRNRQSKIARLPKKA